MDKKVEPFVREGGWVSHHYFYYKAATNFLQEAEELHVAFQLKVDQTMLQIQDTDPDIDNTTLLSYLGYKTSEDLHKLEATCVSVQMFSCMAVEGFLNFYGVRRLGEDFYKQNLERLDISKKLLILIALGEQKLIERKAGIPKLVGTMFERRNRLAHPKSSEVFKDDGTVKQIEESNQLEAARQSVVEMETFFKLFQTYDPSASI